MASPVPTGSVDQTYRESERWNGAGTRARTIANVVLVGAGLAAACAILSNPRGRRIARRVVRAWLGASVPMYLLAETGRAWVQSGRRA